MYITRIVEYCAESSRSYLRTGFLLALLFLASSPAHADSFDFFVLSLSWSPSFCAAEGKTANWRQCGSGKPYAFIVHGLWPQYEEGYPEFCTSQEPRRVPDRLVEAYLDLMPSPALIGHQWRKHGTCTGLRQEDYLALIRKAYERIKIPYEFSGAAAAMMIAPENVEERFIEANPGLEADGIVTTCDRKHLREVRICMTPDLSFRRCPGWGHHSCHGDKVLLPPVR